MKTNKQDLVTLAISSHFPRPPPPTLFCLSPSLLCGCLHSEMGTEWAKLGLEVRLADETLECSLTDRFSLLGQSLIKACKVDLFFLRGEMFNLFVHMLYRWASGMKSPFPVASSEPSGTILGLMTMELDLSLQVEHDKRGEISRQRPASAACDSAKRIRLMMI